MKTRKKKNYDAICTSKAGLEDDEPDEGVEDSVESAAPVVNRAAVKNGDAVEDDSDEEGAEEESKPVTANGDADDDLDSNDHGEESKPAAVEGHLRLQMKMKKNAIFASKTAQPRSNLTTTS